MIRRFLLVLALWPVALFAQYDAVTLSTGEVLKGNVVSQTEDAVVFEHSVLGTLTIPMEQVDTLYIEPMVELDDGTLVPEIETKEPKIWAIDLNASLTSVSGNTDEQTARIGYTGVRTRELNRLATDFSYYLNVSDGSTSDNKATLGAKYDWIRPDSRWFWFLQGRADYNEFESWRYRLASQVGPGYHLIDNDTFKWDLRGGAGFRKEWQSDNEDWKLEGVIGTDFVWIISEQQSLDFTSELFPILDDLDDYRIRTALNWRLALGYFETLDLAINAGLLHEYQSVIDPGKEHTDLRIHFGIGLTY